MAGLSPEEVIEMKHSLSGLAEMCFAAYGEFLKQGFNETQSMRLTTCWLSEVLRGSMGTNE